MRGLAHVQVALAWMAEMGEQVSHSRHAWRYWMERETKEQAGAESAQRAQV